MVRVLNVMSTLSRGGLESRMMDLYRTIDKSKIQFDFLLLNNSKGYFSREVEKMGGQIYKLDSYNGLKDIYKLSKSIEIFLLKHREYQIVYSYYDYLSYYILKGAYRANTKVRIAHSRSGSGPNTLKNSFRNIIKRNPSKYSTNNFAVSKIAGDWLFGKCEYTIIPNALPLEKFKYSPPERIKYRKQLELEDKIVFIHIGNIRTEKNHKFLLDLFSRFFNNRKYKLLLVGEDLTNGYIQNYCTKLGLDNLVEFLGPRSDIRALLSTSDMFLFPSLSEGFPGSALEAQASGIKGIISENITNEVLLNKNFRQLPLDLYKWYEQISIMLETKEVRELVDLSYLSKYDIETVKKFYTNLFLY